MKFAFEHESEIKQAIIDNIDGTYQAILHLLSHAGFVSYGGSIFGCWIEPDGYDFLDSYEKAGDGESFMEQMVQADYDAGITERAHTSDWYEGLCQCSCGRAQETVDMFYRVLKQLDGRK